MKQFPVSSFQLLVTGNGDGWILSLLETGNRKQETVFNG
jgi:hypothetical protein